jgi:hypothetical protein
VPASRALGELLIGHEAKYAGSEERQASVLHGRSRSSLIPVWMKDATSNLSLASIAKIILWVIRMWGISGLMDVWESGRIFQRKHTGYGILVGRKPKKE